MKTLHVDDKTIHVVSNVDEAEQLKKTQEQEGIQFDWLFHGTPEHIDALKRAHSHHLGLADKLRRANPDIHYEMDRIRGEIDTLGLELERVTSAPVELNANFDKYGWSANIRTHNGDETKHNVKFDDPGEATAASGRSLPPKSSRSESGRSRRESTTIKLFERPVLRQYWHNGILYRAKDQEEISSVELFIDLLYVGLIAFNGDKTVEEPTGEAFLRFCITFIPSWKIWGDVSLLISQFVSDDVVQRVGILFLLACLLGYTINMLSAFDTTYSTLIVFYVAARLSIAATNMMFLCLLKHVRAVMTLNMLMILAPTTLWIGSIFVDGGARLALIWLAIAWDLGGPSVSVILLRKSKIFGPWIDAWVKKNFTYYPALNIEHKTERTGAFVSLVLGYSVVALLYQNHNSFGLNAFFGKAVLGLIQAYCFNLLYFDVDASYHHVHAIRRSVWSTFTWTWAHLPFIMGFTIAGAALSRLVLTTDCLNAKVEDLMPAYQLKSSDEIELGIRWFYCCGLGVALICTAIISACHIHTPIPTQRVRKRTRLTFRCAVALVWILLPLAKTLNSLNLIAVTTSMMFATVALEVYGMSCSTESFLAWQECRYSPASSSNASRTDSRTEVGTPQEADEDGGEKAEKPDQALNYLADA